MQYVLAPRLTNVVVSRPRTGTTWLQVLLASYLAFTYDLDITEPFEEIAARCRLAFTHDPQRFTGIPIANDYTERRVLLLLRDPRDAIASAYAVEAEGQGFELLDYVTRTAKRFAAFYTEWLDFTNRKTLHGFMTLTYEQLYSDTAKALLQLVGFFNYRINLANIRQAVDYASLQHMRELQEEGRFANRVRYGKVGNYHTVLGDAEYAAIKDAFGELGQLWSL